MRFKTYFCAFFTILVIYIGICDAKKSDHENNRSLLPSERGNSEVQLRNTESNLPSLSSELQILKEFGSNSTDELNPSGKPKRKRKKNKHHNHRARNGHRRGHLRSGHPHHHKRQRTRPTDILRAEEDPKAEVGKKSDDKTSKLETSSTELRNGRRNKRLRSRGSRHLGFNTHHHSHHHPHRSHHESHQNDERPQHHHRQHRRLHHRRKHHNSQDPVNSAAKLNALDKIDETSIRRILDR